MGGYRLCIIILGDCDVSASSKFLDPTHTVSGQLFYILYVFMNFLKYALFTQWTGIAMSSGGICIYKCF